ncbi:phosphosulfolactate synthase [Candidatus Coxiella mudrowiae]|uniref:phosphosulfolactate synthase n=1 Tax=Candidatus Coxiella mudrowiae TaxID=2054173 RepID=UPI003CC8372D
MFEAPKKHNKLNLFKEFGENFNLRNIRNIAPNEIISLETLRLGLRSDTLLNVYKRSLEVNGV